ncbi:MAG: dihydroneopterin aldolase [Ginsengibacter sp.]|jgi:dihydroneopterin aldolase
MITIRLEQLRFNAYHGIHEEEKILGNTYIVDCLLTFPEFEKVIQSIDETINYVKVYDIIKKRMAIPTSLLETVIMEIGIEIENHFPQLKSIQLSIKKLHPPIKGMEGTVGVNWEKLF